MKRKISPTVLRFTAGLVALLFFSLCCPAPSQAREVQQRMPIISDVLEPVTGPPGVGVLGGVPADTFYFGGTIWDAAQARWEAAEPSSPGWANRKMWTWSPSGFGGTPHSGLNMDGWVGDDNTDDPDNTFRVMDSGQIGACVISGSKSLFCGKTTTEASAACYVDASGTGYGNNWRQAVVTPTFDYSAGDQITLSYDYTVDTELDYDFVYVMLEHYDSGAGEWVADTVDAEWSGVTSGSDLVDVDSYLSAQGSVQFRVKFVVTSDGGYSDQDGLNATACGAAAFDNVVLDGSVTYSEDFEDEASGVLPAGWQRVSDAIGAFAQARHMADLPVSLTEDPCVLAEPSLCEVADSVIILVDMNVPSYPHPVYQDAYVMSPVIDLSSHPGMAGKLVRLERFAKLPLNDHIFMQWRVRYAPGCESGGWTGWLNDNYVYYTPEGTSCAPWVIDLSSYIASDAENMQVAVGVMNYCTYDPWDLGCTFVSNATPYYDNITVGAYGSAQAPYISMREYDYWQDQFAEDGTLNAASTADTRTAIYLSNLTPPIFGDTLVCRGSADNMEVYFVFRLARMGPEQATTNSFFTSWFPGVAGGGWVEVRMDTAEVTAGAGTLPAPGTWMCAFHENDPVSIANGLPEGTEILPNNLFVPGTRVEYFLKAKYSGSSDFFLLPDTTGGHQAEFEILPMMTKVAGTYTWPCMLVVDHFGGRGNSGETNGDRIARHLKAKGIKFDMFNRLGPASDLRNGIGRWNANPGQIGGPGTPEYNWGPGATEYQMRGYRYCILNAGDVYGYSIYQQDANLLTSWIQNAWTQCEDNNKLLWISGSNVCRELNRRTPWGLSFLNTTLCAKYISSMYQQTAGDYTYCLPMNGMAGGRIGGSTPEAYVLRSQTCPKPSSTTWGQNVIDVSSSSGCTGAREVEYHAGYNATQEVAAVSNVLDYSSSGSGNVNRILTEAYDFCLVRSGDTLGPPACGSDSYLSERIDSVLSWAKYDDALTCGPPSGVWVPFPEPPEVVWHNLICEGTNKKALVCPGVKEGPPGDTCETAWIHVRLLDFPCQDPVPDAVVTLAITSSTCDSLLCAPVAGVTDANGYAELHPRGSVNASAGPGCCSVSYTITAMGYTLATGTLDWLSPDLNGDGIVDGLDTGILMGDWGTSACRSDFNCDGVVDQGDMDILEAHYVHSCTGQTIAVEETPEPLPVVTTLSQNYPNPFNPATEIKFAVAEPGRVVLRIYDIVGRPVRTLLDDTRERGYHKVAWDGRDDSGGAVASGVYFYSIQAPGCEERKKMVLVR